MMRRLWRLQSDRGGQHAEAGVLMATLIVLAGAVIVGSVPQLSTAVADQWVCNISDPGSARCAGETAQPTPVAARDTTSTAEEPAVAAVVHPVAATAGGDPAREHFPKANDNSGEGGVWKLPSGRDMTMDSCHLGLTTNCIGGLGRYYECSTEADFDPEGGITVTSSCSRTITSKTPLTCTDEGLSPGWDTCEGPGGVILHCTNPNAVGNRLCNDAAHDADVESPGITSCGEQNGSRPVSSVVCMGENGTLYERVCRWTDTEPRVCQKADRGISASSPTLTQCSQDPGETKGAVVQCTYTPGSCVATPVAGRTCADEAVTVRCLVVGAEYQQCQSLGLLVPEGGTVETVCLDLVAKPFCQNSDSYILAPPTPDENAVTTAVGGVDITINPDDKFNVPTGQGTTSLSIDELTALCTKDPTTCDAMIDSTVGTGVAEAEAVLREHGLCTTDCDAFLDRAADSMDGVATNDGVDIAIGLTSVIIGNFLVGGLVYNGADEHSVGTAVAAAGVVAAFGILRKLVPEGAGAAAKAAIIAAGTRAMDGLQTGITALASLWEAQVVANPGMTPAQQMAAANRVFDELAVAMEEGRGA